MAAVERAWTMSAPALFERLGTSAAGLSSRRAEARLRRAGPNTVAVERRLTWLRALWRQLGSPLLLLLVFAAAVSLATGAWVDATIVLAIVIASAGVGFHREYRAERVVARLRERVRTRASVRRDGRIAVVPAEQIVPGDIVVLSAGSIVPADAVVIDATDCYVSEAILTGESFPAPKTAGPVDAGAALAQRTNSVFLGTNVRSGTAECVVVATGSATEFGAIAHRLSLRSPETNFDRGLRRFGYFLTVAMLVMVLVVFVAHMFRGRPPAETLLFAIALAVGLSPELLPAILGVNLARGAEAMAKQGVVVKRLNAIENLGSMDVLCTDKTGTLTEGVVEVEGSYDVRGERDPRALELAALNAALETGLRNPLDEAILAATSPALEGIEKLAEIPFDFTRKRTSVIVSGAGGTSLVTKGAFRRVLEVCSRIGGLELDATAREAAEARHDQWSGKGIRVLAVATRAIEVKARYARDDETELDLVGFVTFLDRPKNGVSEAIAALRDLGVGVKLITGDGRLVAEHVAKLVGLPSERVLTGADLEDLNDEALWREAERTDLFVEVDPNQKERIILALKKMGHVVGFLGDGVNDAPAMHAADTSLSVEHAVDVAREAADFVLLESDLKVIRRGIEEGRKTFANTLKYVLTTTSANLGNMVSMAIASLFLPFLPLTAGQVLLNNFLSDIPAIGMASDRVDPELVDRPRSWDMRFIGKFMIEFGILSSLFDVLTFAALVGWFGGATETFRTAWFIESLLTELVIALVVRTRRTVFQSRPGRVLFYTTVAVIALTFALPYVPFVEALGFVPLPAPLMLFIVAIAAAYAFAAELLKLWFYRGHRTSPRG